MDYLSLEVNHIPSKALDLLEFIYFIFLTNPGRFNLLIPELQAGQWAKAKVEYSSGEADNFLLLYFYNRFDAPS